MASLWDDLFTPVGSLTAQGRENEKKRQALAAMQNSPVMSKYAVRPEMVAPNTSGHTLMGGVEAGTTAYNKVKKDGEPPAPQSVDPTWDAFSGWIGRNLTTKGQFQGAANAANAPMVGPILPRPDIPQAPPPQAPSPYAGATGLPGVGPVGDVLSWIKSKVQGTSVPGTPLDTTNGWTVGDVMGSPSPSAPDVADPVLPDTAPIPTDRTQMDAPPEEVAAPAPTIEEEIQKYKELVNTIYPKPDTSETDKQRKSDEFSANSLQRARLMAQLALSSGIKAQAGYGDVAKGFAAAGAEYDQGFNRYQTALQDSADRELSKRDVNYKDDLLRSQAALKLYSDQASIGRDAVEKSRKEHMEYLMKGAFPPATADGYADPAVTDAQKEAYRRSLEEYMRTGNFYPPNATDVRDSSQ